MQDPFHDEVDLVTWLTPEDFDALVERLDQPASFCPRVARVLMRQAPWDRDCDKTSTSAPQ